MLSPAHRLPKEDISQVLRRGMHVRGDAIELIYKKTTGVPRFAFIVSTKIDKRATARNRMRRTLSESVRHLVATIQPVDGIIIAKNNVAELSQTEVETNVLALLRTANIVLPL